MPKTLADVIVLFEEIATSRGENYRFPPRSDRSIEEGYWNPSGSNCMYSTKSGAPACIVGELIFRVAPEKLPRYGLVNDAYDILYSEEFEDIFDAGSLEDIAQLAVQIQEYQDTGLTWPHAVRKGLAQSEKLR